MKTGAKTAVNTGVTDVFQLRMKITFVGDIADFCCMCEYGCEYGREYRRRWKYRLRVECRIQTCRMKSIFEEILRMSLSECVSPLKRSVRLRVM